MILKNIKKGLKHLPANTTIKVKLVESGKLTNLSLDRLYDISSIEYSRDSEGNWIVKLVANLPDSNNGAALDASSNEVR